MVHVPSARLHALRDCVRWHPLIDYVLDYVYTAVLHAALRVLR